MSTLKKHDRSAKGESNNDEDLYIEDSRDYNLPKESLKYRMFFEIIGNSSVHALSQLGRARSRRRQLFWTLVLIMSLCGCIYYVNSFLNIFFMYPVLIDVKVLRGKSQEFPAVTFCNLNRLRSRYVGCAVESLNWFKCLSKMSRPEDIPISGQMPARPPVLTETKLLFSVPKATNESAKNYKNHAKKILTGYTKLDDDSKKCYGHRLNEFIKRCSFNSVTCKHSDFSYFYDKQYGNCYTFNKNNNRGSRLVKTIGTESGLEIVLDIEMKSYSKITPSTGAKVIIHSRQEDPNPMESGINIIPGFESHVSMATTSHRRLPPPYRDLCETYKSNGTFKSSQLTCTHECTQRTNLRICGCVDPFLPNYKLRLCNLVNTTQLACLVRVMDEMSTGKILCDCHLPCTSTKYDLQVTSTKLSSRFQSSDKHFGESYDPRFCSNKFSLNSLESFSKLKIFFRSLDHTIYAQKPMYSDTEFFSHFGGNLSLWLGLSFVALYEFAEKLLIFLKNCFLSPKNVNM